MKKKWEPTISTFINNLLLQIINLSFLRTAVARGTEAYSYAVISQFFEL